MTKKEYEQSVLEGMKPVLIEAHTVHRENCCDCGLSHRVIYDLDKRGRLLKIVYRDGYHSAEVREAMPEVDIKYIIKILRAELKRRKLEKTKS